MCKTYGMHQAFNNAHGALAAAEIQMKCLIHTKTGQTLSKIPRNVFNGFVMTLWLMQGTIDLLVLSFCVSNNRMTWQSMQLTEKKSRRSSCRFQRTLKNFVILC